MADIDYSTEIWRDIPGENGRYQVSSLGRVRTAPRILKPWQNKVSGYFYVGLGRRKHTTIHRLVCRAFHGDPPSDEHWQVAHGDGNRVNNAPENLRWATPRENGQDAVKHGTSPLIQYRDPPAGERHGMARLTEADVAEIRRLAATPMERQEIAHQFGISRNQLWRILTGKSWKHLRGS